MKVIVRGGIFVYELSGSYQLYVKEMQLDGVGVFYLVYEELKKKFVGEGLFDDWYKQVIFVFLVMIGVVMLLMGVVVRDVIIIFKRRYFLVKVIVFFVFVQGENVSRLIVKCIEEVNV